MNILATIIGRAILLKPPYEIVPLGGVFLPALFEALKERYSFGNAPNVPAMSPEQVQKEGYKFSIGKIRKGGRDYPIQELVVFPDGLVCSSDQTDTAELMLEDLLKFGKEQFDFRPVQPATRKLFFSQVSVKLDAPIDSLASKIDAVSKIIGERQKKVYGIEDSHNAKLNSISFDFDKTQLSPLFGTLVPFTIERKIGRPYSENEFISTAPLRTSDHLTVLDQIEKALID